MLQAVSYTKRVPPFSICNTVTDSKKVQVAQRNVKGEEGGIQMGGLEKLRRRKWQEASSSL